MCGVASDKFAGLAGGGVADNVRRAGGHHRAALGTAARAHINDVVCVADHIQVMLNDDDGGAVLDQGLEHAEQNLHIGGVQADGGLIKDKQRVRLGFAHFAGQLQALGLAAGKAGRFLAKGQVAKAEFL